MMLSLYSRSPHPLNHALLVVHVGDIVSIMPVLISEMKALACLSCIDFYRHIHLQFSYLDNNRVSKRSC